MSDKNSNGHMGEPELVRLYMQLTGTSESRARSVFMFHEDVKQTEDGGQRTEDRRQRTEEGI